MFAVSPVLPGQDIEERTIAENQPQYSNLPAVRVREDATGRVITRWSFTEEERKRIAAGQDLYLCTQTFNQSHQPVLLEIMTAAEILSFLGLRVIHEHEPDSTSDIQEAELAV